MSDNERLCAMGTRFRLKVPGYSGSGTRNRYICSPAINLRVLGFTYFSTVISGRWEIMKSSVQRGPIWV